jgi:hypothetical protein
LGGGDGRSHPRRGGGAGRTITGGATDGGMNGESIASSGMLRDTPRIGGGGATVGVWNCGGKSNRGDTGVAGVIGRVAIRWTCEKNVIAATPIITDAAHAPPPVFRLGSAFRRIGLGSSAGSHFGRGGGSAGLLARVTGTSVNTPAADASLHAAGDIPSANPHPIDAPHRRQNRDTSGISLAQRGQRISSMPHLGTTATIPS